MSGSNFLLGIVLARWLSLEQYGAFALAFSIFLLLSLFHQAILLEPMSVLGPSLYRGNHRRYVGVMLCFQAGFGLLTMAALGAAALAASLTGHRDMAGALAGVSLGAPFILLLWLGRTASYVELAAARSARAAALYSAILIAGLIAVWRNNLLSACSVFLLMGLGGLIASGVLIVQLRPMFNGLRWREVWREHWKYGRWAIASSLATWVPGNIFYSFTSAFLGMGSTGALRALMNLTLPVAHSGSAMSNIFTPWISGIFGREGRTGTRKPVGKVTLLYASGAIVWGGICVAASSLMFRLLYGGKFLEWRGLVPIVALGAVFQLATYGPAIGLRALQSPASVFAAYGASAAVSLLAGIPAMRIFGLAGVVTVTALSAFSAFLAVVLLYQNRSAERAEQLVPVILGASAPLRPS